LITNQVLPWDQVESTLILNVPMQCSKNQFSGRVPDHTMQTKFQSQRPSDFETPVPSI
jgi:hypothetical protein